MQVGEIIKFYRERNGLTQAQLGQGICTATHVSKIEHGKTAFSSEIIALFSERLQIDIQKEIESFQDIEKQLHHWHHLIILQRMKDIEKMKENLEASPFIHFSKYASLFHLLQARYYLLNEEDEKAFQILKALKNKQNELLPYEKNLLLHALGIYYLFHSSNSKNEQKALQLLKRIKIEEYGNYEYYYHLAVAYHFMESKMMSYIYAEKALRHFKKTNNFLHAFNAESLILVQVGSEIYLDFKELEERYQNLIHDSEVLGAMNKKGMFLSNLGLEYYKREEYAQAQKCYDEALKLAEKSSTTYLKRLYNYVNTCAEGKLLRKTILLKKAREGISLAKKFDNRLYLILFKLVMLNIENQLDKYYNYLEKYVLPYFKKNNEIRWINRFGKKLYDHYVETEQPLKAYDISSIFMSTIS
ncbi:hypothetical protein J6TS2_22460 [Heyndrickxia sporothermodurans]|nr:hypothetical protein J6TS2_22460 [Heyndrickxia sporothermodurans]